MQFHICDSYPKSPLFDWLQMLLSNVLSKMSPLRGFLLKVWVLTAGSFLTENFEVTITTSQEIWRKSAVMENKPQQVQN